MQKAFIIAHIALGQLGSLSHLAGPTQASEEKASPPWLALLTFSVGDWLEVDPRWP
jgi:hypothetical protein